MTTPDVLYEEAEARKRREAQRQGYPVVEELPPYYVAAPGVPSQPPPPPQTPIFGTQPLPQPELPPYYVAAPGQPSLPPPGPLPGEDAQLAREQVLNEEAARATPDILTRQAIEPLPGEAAAGPAAAMTMPLEQVQAAGERMMGLAGQVRTQVDFEQLQQQARMTPEQDTEALQKLGIATANQRDQLLAARNQQEYEQFQKTPPIVGELLLATLLAPIAPNFMIWTVGLGLESLAEEKGVIPGKPVTRTWDFAVGTAEKGLEAIGVPESVRPLLANLAVMAVLGVSIAKRKALTDLAVGLAKVSREDAAATIAALKGAVERKWQTAVETGVVPRGFGLEEPVRPTVHGMTEAAGKGAVPPSGGLAETGHVARPPREFRPTPEDLAADAIERDIRAKYRASIPAMSDIEARTRPLPPEVRARLKGMVSDPQLARPEELEALWRGWYKTNWWTNFSDFLSGKIPALRGPLARTPADIAVRDAKRLRDITVGIMGQQSSIAIDKWRFEARDVLGLGRDGFAKKVKPLPGVDIPTGLKGNIEHIVEHAEKYDLSPEQAAFVDRFANDSLLTEIVRLEQTHGIDVQEVANYFPRYAKKTPKGWDKNVGAGGPGGAGYRVRLGHAKHRIFGDVEERYAAGFVDDPIQGLYGRAQSGVEGIANKRMMTLIKEMGFKPSEAFELKPFVEAAKEARAVYKDARAAATRIGASVDNKEALAMAEVTLEDSLRALRGARGLWREKQPQLFGRIMPPEVVRAFSRFVPKGQPIEQQFFQAVRGLKVSEDLSGTAVQNWFTAYRNPVAWVKAIGYGLYGFADQPLGYVVANYEYIMRGIQYGHIRAPTEWLLREGGPLGKTLLHVPGIKPSQRAFEWQVFVAQTERSKAVQRLCKTPEELMEMGAVLRKQSGILMMPGFTEAQVRWASRMAFAPQFAGAIHSALLDGFRGGPAGREALKSLFMAFGGAAGLTIAINYKVNGEMPNMTDPDLPGFWGIKLGGGYAYPLGPYQPTFVALFRTGRLIQDASQGKTPSTRDWQAIPRLLEAKGGIEPRLILAIGDALGVPFNKIRGDPYQHLRLKTAQDWKNFANQFMEPIGIQQATQGIQRKFPWSALELLGVRTSPMPTWGGIDLEVQGMKFSDSKGNVIEHYRDLTEPQKIEADKNPKIKRYLISSGGDDDPSKFTAMVERDTTNRLAAAVKDLRDAGPTAEALDQFKNDLDLVRQDNRTGWKWLRQFGFVPEGYESTNPDIKLRNAFYEYTSKAIRGTGGLDGDAYGKLTDDFRNMIGEELWKNTLVPQLVADRNPQVQQAQIWAIDVSDSGIYQLVENDGSADADARRRMRASDPELDVKGYLLGRWPSVFPVHKALAEEMFRKWMALGSQAP
jgi:hypothetical protein